MNKKLLTTAIVSMMVLSTGAAMAAPVEIDGSASYRYRSDSNTDTSAVKTNTNGSIYRVTLNAKTEIAPSLSVYGRFAAQGLSKEGFGSDMIQKDSGKFIGEVDQFGVIYTANNFTYKIGKQDAVIGGTGLLYDSTGFLGKNNGLSAISISGTTGVTSVSILAGQENSYGTIDNKVYAARASYNPAKNLTLGATFARFAAAAGSHLGKSANAYAVDFAYTAGKATYSAEYAKSNMDTKNKAYDLGISYAFDTKNSASVTYFNIQKFATFYQEQDAWEMTGYEAYNKGFYYSFTHQFTKDTSATLFYRDKQSLEDSSKNTSFRATVNYKF